MSYWRVEYDDGWWTFYKDGIEIKLDNLNFGDLIVDEINNANQRIAELESKQRWISVKERLPEIDKEVLIYDGYREMVVGWLEGFHRYKYFRFRDERWHGEVTHWMPLPESPNDTQKETFVYGKDSKPLPCPFCGEIVKECNDVATPIDVALRKRIAELEGKIDQLTAHSDIERQDDKSSNDTQKETFVYGKERER